MFTLNCKGRLLVIERPIVMGILNVTPDSFYAGSCAEDTDAILARAEQLLSQGAAILDIGGQSTRPGSRMLGAEEELSRVLGPVAAIHRRFPEAILSIDTFHARVAVETVAAGVSMVNDVSGGQDPEMLPAVGRLGVPYVCMHIKNPLSDLHRQPHYEDVTREVLDYFIQKLATCKKAGIHDVIIDPGFGFDKNSTHNFQLLRHMDALRIPDRPLLAGLSRKSTIYKTLGTTAAEALNGTTVLNVLALQKGAHILRVHDVREAVEAITLYEAYCG